MVSAIRPLVSCAVFKCLVFDFDFGFVCGVLVSGFDTDPEVLSKIALRMGTASVALCECVEPLYGIWDRARGWL